MSLAGDAVEACWAHNPEVRGSKPRSANIFICYSFSLHPYLATVILESKSLQLQCRSVVEIIRLLLFRSFSFFVETTENDLTYKTGYVSPLDKVEIENYLKTSTVSRVAQWKRAGPINQRSEDHKPDILEGKSLQLQ